MSIYLKWNTILFGIVIAHLAGIYLFYLAFIYQNNSTDTFNMSENPFHSKMRFKDEQQKEVYRNQWFPTQSEQMIFQVIDGFYFPWAVNKEEQENFASKKSQGIPSAYYTNVPFNQPILRLIKEPQNTILMEAYADGPTLSAVRIKAILRANLPLHIEVINNIRGINMPDDNIIYQTKVNGQGKKLVFLGFLYWDQFVGQHFDRKFLTKENGLDRSIMDDQKIFNRLMEEQKNDDWGSCFCHYEAIDMAVHSYRSVQEITYPTVSFHNDLLSKLIDSTHQEGILNQTIIYMSDHGQNEKHWSQHGGYSDLEKQVIVFGYDKRGFIQKENRDIGQIMDREFLLSPKINQIDMSATYCMLRGIPLPALNIGVIIPDFFINRPDVDNTVVVNNYFVNMQQIFQYINILREDKKKTITTYNSIKEDIDHITSLYNQLFDLYEANGSIENDSVKEYVNTCIKFARRIKEVFQEEITGPNILNSKLSSVFFYIVGISTVILCSRLTNMLYFPQGESLEENEVKQASERDINRKYFKLGMFGALIALVALQYIISSFTFFLTLFAFNIFGILYLLRIQLRNTKILNLITPIKVSNSKFYGFIDTLLILIGIVFNSVLRATNDLFERTYDLTQALFLVFYFIWLIMILFSRHLTRMQKMKRAILLTLVPLLTYECGYHSSYKSQHFNQFFIIEEYKQYFASTTIRFYYPMALLTAIYTFLIYKSTKVILGPLYLIKRSAFGFLCFIQLYFVLKFYFIQSEQIKPLEGEEIYNLPTNYLFLSQLFLIITELFKIIFINREPIAPPNFSWKLATFLMNFYLCGLYVIHYDSIIKYSVLLLIIYLVGHIHNSLKIMQNGSKYIFLFLLTSWFFYVSDHMERINELHIEVLNAGALFDGFFYPLLNGTLNTFFGQFSVALAIPLFVLAEQYQKNQENIDSETSQNRSFLDIIFSNRSDLNLFRKSYDTEGYSIQREISGNSKIKTEVISDEYYTMNIRAYLYFLLPLIFSFAISTMRNALKPFDYFINKYYIPSYFFQVMFEGVFLVIFMISYFLIRYHNTIPKRTLVDYNQMETEDQERELELQDGINNDEP